MTYPLLKSIYAQSQTWQHPMPVPSSDLAVIAAAAHDLSSCMTALVGLTALLLELTPEGDAARPIVLDMQSAAADGAANVMHLVRYAGQHGAKPSSKSLAKTLEDLR